jgi:uncharacterized protein (DUF1499 family)
MILLACLASGASVLFLLLGPLGTKFRLWPFGIGFLFLGVGVLLGVAAVVLGALGGWFGGGRTAAVVAVVVAIAAVAVPVQRVVAARSSPPIHDISTDLDDPPGFVAVLPLRTGNVSPPEYDGPATAEQQRRAFSDIQPLMVNHPLAAVFDAASATAHELGWTVVSEDPKLGQIEAIDSTFWFGFEDDIVIRLRQVAEGTRVDVRSKSRVGIGDLGTNAQRVRTYMAALRRRVG